MPASIWQSVIFRGLSSTLPGLLRIGPTFEVCSLLGIVLHSLGPAKPNTFAALDRSGKLSGALTLALHPLFQLETDISPKWRIEFLLGLDCKVCLPLLNVLPAALQARYNPAMGHRRGERPGSHHRFARYFYSHTRRENLSCLHSYWDNG